jgi:hypothetical protein
LMWSFASTSPNRLVISRSSSIFFCEAISSPVAYQDG